MCCLFGIFIFLVVFRDLHHKWCVGGGGRLSERGMAYWAVCGDFFSWFFYVYCGVLLVELFYHHQI